MKTMIYSAAFALLFSAQAASAVTCKVLEFNTEVTGKTKIEAEKKAWNVCIDNLLAKRAQRDGDISVDAGLADGEHCVNDSKIICR